MADLGFTEMASIVGFGMTSGDMPNQALQRIPILNRDWNPRVPRTGSRSLSLWADYEYGRVRIS